MLIIGRRVAIGLCIVLLIVGCIMVLYLLDPGLFSNSSPELGQTLTIGNKPPGNNPPEDSSSATHVVNQITSTATGVYCNCTDTYSQG